MDVLSSVLRTIKLDSAIFFNAEFSEPWGLWSPDSRELLPMLAPDAGHVIIYHLICEGTAYVELKSGRRVTLRAGDLIMFPHGDGHQLGGGRGAAVVDAEAALPTVLGRDLTLLQTGGGGARSRFICGFLACDRLGLALLDGLPSFITVNIREDEAGRWLEQSLRLSVAEAERREAGSDAMLAKLSELAFAETLRRYVRQMPPERTGWLAALGDAQLSRALALLHARPAHAWTTVELAREAGLSRTLLSVRFRQVLGESPIAYLTRWRLLLAARALADTSLPVVRIAAEVGYDSESAFNRAFKRWHGLPPARYRRERKLGHAAPPALVHG